VPTLRFVSPERRWRAASLLLLAAWVMWRSLAFTGSLRLPGLIVGGVATAALLAGVLPVVRSCLIVSDEGLTDRRAFRRVRLSWPQISEFRVARPGGPWGGYCVVADCRDGTQVDLLSIRAYSRSPSSHHLDELHLICWTLDERRAAQHGDRP
jgi:hypothetical protein